MILIDKLCYQSKLRYVNAAEKSAYAMLTLLMCVVSRSPVVASAAFAVNGLLTVGAGKIPLSRYLRLLLIPAAFLLLGTGALVLNLSGEPMDAFAVSVGNWYITGSREALGQAARLCATAFAAVSCLYFLALSTTMTDIMGVLAKLHLPSFFIELMLLIYRFIFVLLETASSILTAQESRLGNRDLRTSVRSFGGMASALFLLALKRSNALYDAMESRCYDGRIRVLSREYPPKKKEIVLIAGFETVLLFITIWGIIK